MEFKKLKIITFAVLFFVAFQSQSFALDSKEQAKNYRQKGYYAQQNGNIQEAIEYYLQAIRLNPDFAAAYNDLGIAYETLDELELAEDSYKKCLEIDRNYLAVYTNLAFLYEKKRQYKKAAFFWKKRSDLGDPREYWTKKAKKNLKELSAFSKDIKEMLIQDEADQLTQEIDDKKTSERIEKLARAKKHFQNGKKYFEDELYSEAKEQFKKALLLSPNDPIMLDYYKKAKKLEEEEKVKFHVKEGLKYYERGDMSQARDQFEDLLTVIPEESNR